MSPTSLLPLLLLLLLSPPPTTPQPTPPTPPTPTTPTPTPTLLPPIPLFSPSPSPSPLSCPTPTPAPSGLSLTQIMSRVMGGASISCWIFVTAPQIYKNYKNGTAEAIAFAFIMCWVLGDLTNLLGCLLTHQLLTQTALAVYYVFADAFMVAQIVYYKVRDSRRKYAPLDQELKSGASDKGGPPSPRLSTQNIAVGAAVVGATLSQTVSASSSDPCNPGKTDIEILGVTFAWTSAALYLSSRVPQVYKNFKRKSTDGLSFGMFVLTVAGNCTYAASIFLESRNKEYLLNSLPYIVGSLGTLSFDLLVWFQFWLYGSMSKKKDLYDLEDIPPPPQYRPKTLNNLRSNYYEKLGVREEVGDGRGQDVDLPAYNEFGEKIDMI